MGEIIHISVNNKVAARSARDGSIVCGNDGYQVQFALDSEWDDVPAKARFIWNGKHQDVPIVGGVAAVPRIYNATEAQVGVYSEDESLQTTTSARIPCKKSILCEGSAPTEGNEALYASEAQEAAQRAEEAARRAEAAGGTGGGGTGEPGAAGEDGATFTPSVSADGVLSWTNDKELPNPDPVDLKGPKGDPGKTPVKGTDYMTEADLAEIVELTLDALPAAEEVRL